MCRLHSKLGFEFLNRRGRTAKTGAGSKGGGSWEQRGREQGAEGGVARSRGWEQGAEGREQGAGRQYPPQTGVPRGNT